MKEVQLDSTHAGLCPPLRAGSGGGWLLITAWDIGKGLKRGRRERGSGRGDDHRCDAPSTLLTHLKSLWEL